MFDITAIYKWFRKHFNTWDIILLSGIVLVFLATRLIKLDSFPIFGDEGIYIHWAKTAWHDASWRFISLTDGKQPLQTWGIIPFLKLFPNNALLAGRLFSVLTGLAGLTGMYCLLFYLYGKRAAFWGSVIYVFTPYFLFYDRMALSDSGVNAGFIWMLFFSVLFADTIRLDTAIIFGIVSGFSLLTKSSARLFLGLSFLAPVLFFAKNVKKFIHRWINFILLFAISSGLALLIYNVQRLSPFLHFVEEKNKTFVMTFGEFFKTPFAYVKGNVPLVPYYIMSEAGVFLFVGGLIGLVLLLIYKRNLGIYLLCWFFFPFVAIAFFSKVLYPRYLNFFASLLVVTFAYVFTRIKKSSLLYMLVILTLVSVAYYDYAILFSQKNIPFPAIDRGQYITGITAGWGVKDIMDYARKKSHEKRVILIAEGDFGVIGDQLEVFINQGDNMMVKGYWPLTEQNLIDNQQELKDSYVFVVFSHTQTFPSNWPITLIKQYPNPGNQSSIYFFRLTK